MLSWMLTWLRQTRKQTTEGRSERLLLKLVCYVDARKLKMETLIHAGRTRRNRERPCSTERSDFSVFL